ncbi:MAG: DUF4124 domain-containing protein [Pseudomonadota bacterium]
MRAILIAAALASLCAGASAQNVYKCKTPSGGVMLSDTQCAGADRVLVQSAPAAAAPAGASASEEACKQAVLGSLADPYSAVITKVAPGGTSIINYEGVRVIANRTLVSINSKNPAGAYTGVRIVPCYVSQGSGKVLSVGGSAD